METLEKQELEEQEAIMPEGYGEGDDYFQEEDWGKGDKVADGGFERMAGRNGPWRGVCRV